MRLRWFCAAILAGVLLLPGMTLASDFSVTPWDVNPPSGDWADYGITYTLPVVNRDGLTWYASDIRHVPAGENGTDPGNHNAYVYTYAWEGWPNDPDMPVYWALHVPVHHVQVAYWCSGEEKPSPNNSHWIVQETWPGAEIIVPDAPGTDFVISRNNICRIAVWDPEHPDSSGIVSNIHAMHPDEGDGVHVGHHSFKISFTALDSTEMINTPTPAWTVTPTVTVTPVATVDMVAVIREEAWNAVGVNYNPDAAFGVFARRNGLGVPLTNEFDVSGYRVQGFAGGVVFTEIGNWQTVNLMLW